MSQPSALELLVPSGAAAPDGLSWVTHTARATLSGVDGVSVTLLGGPRPVSVGATDPMVAAADALQYELKEGPVIDAGLGVPISHALDIVKDQRWRAYGSQVACLGVRSQTAIPLCSRGRLVGVLSLYSTQLGPLDDDVVEAAVDLAQVAGDLVALARDIGAVAQSESSAGSVTTSTSAPLRKTVISVRRPIASSNISRCND